MAGGWAARPGRARGPLPAVPRTARSGGTRWQLAPGGSMCSSSSGGGGGVAALVVLLAAVVAPSVRTGARSSSSSSSSGGGCQTLHDPCHVAGTPANASSCCVCTPWPHCSPGRGENFVCDGAPSDPGSRCVAGPPPPPWGTPCPPPPPPSPASSHSTTASKNNKTVRLWIGNPFGWPKGGPPSQVAFCIVLAELEKLRDVVDEITLTGYYVADPDGGNMSTGGLLRSEGTLEVVQGLRDAGWHNIHAMIGGCPAQYGGTNGSIDVYRHYVKSAAFVRAVVDEVTTQQYSGINVDFEPSDCLKSPAVPCGVADCEAMGGMLSEIKDGVGPGVMVSVDTGQSALASTGCLNTSHADRLISMNSYYDRRSFDISLPRDIAAVGVERYGLGVCPTCSAPLCKAPGCNNLTDITERMAAAEQAGVMHLDFWASAKQPDWAFGAEWWAAIRQWKAAAAHATPAAAAEEEVESRQQRERHQCAGELLYNGICLPAAWPPANNLTTTYKPPPYLQSSCTPGSPGCRPAVVSIAGSRQLLVDDFLIETSVNLSRTFHRPIVQDQPVLVPDQPWESESANPTIANTTTGVSRVHSAMPFSGGITYDSRDDVPHDQRYKLFYECGINNGVCLATSADGLAWAKPLLSNDGGRKTNMVVKQPHDGTSVMLVMDDPDETQRFKMTMAPVQFCPEAHDVTERTNQTRLPYLCDNSGNGCSVAGVGGGPGQGCQHLLVSADGLKWRAAINKTGSCGDRSTGFYNALRRKYTWSIRPQCIPEGSSPGGRWRGLVEADSFGAAANWDHCFEGQCQPMGDACTTGRVRAWFGADTLDPPICTPDNGYKGPQPPGGWSFCRPHVDKEEVVAQVYNVDAVAYESVLIGLFSIYSGVLKPPRGPSAMEWQGDEHNAIHVGYSRDGFYFHRPSPQQGAGPTPINHTEAEAASQTKPTTAAAAAAAAEWRTPFIDENERADALAKEGEFTYGNVQSVGGGFLTVGDELRFFFSARSGTADLNCTTGVAHLRRDGFAHLHVSDGNGGGGGSFRTRPLRYLPENPPWDPAGLFVNVNTSAAGASMAIKLLKDGDIVAHSVPITGVNSTKQRVAWLDGDAMGAISGGASFQLEVYLRGHAELYSFWVSSDACGTSGGPVAAGGPGFPMGRDQAECASSI